METKQENMLVLKQDRIYIDMVWLLTYYVTHILCLFFSILNQNFVRGNNFCKNFHQKFNWFLWNQVKNKMTHQMGKLVCHTWYGL